VGRHYLFDVYTSMGLLQKQEDANNFWRASGFHKKRNQIVSGVSYKEFITLYSDGFKTLTKTNPELSPQDYLQQFIDLFVQKGPEIQAWEKEYNKVRYSEYLKNLLTDNEKKSEQISSLMRENLDISETEVDQKLEASGMKGMGIRDKWIYWKNREILYSLKEYTLHKRLGLTILEGRERM
jgi:hypothetical protein